MFAKVQKSEKIEVRMEICVQGEAFLPIPLEEELIMKVKDALGHILSWLRHLVIRCSDLPIEPDEVVEKENAKENGKENAKKDDKIVENKKESEKEKENEKKDDERRNTRIRIENNVLLRMTAMMVDGQVSKVDSIKVQCEDSLYGYESYTYLTWDDFQTVFALEELTGAVITSYTMAIVLIQITISIRAHLTTNMLNINNTWAGREAATAIVLPGLVERLQQPLFCGDLLDLEYLTLSSTERTLECKKENDIHN
ncbi:hypothetical protein L1987_07904 [Smallanthus sonchifolius]|uniref:Uncharacterized protein n=1 Tax=Smallanthus sonchifolius TaxID=185202 RepID=A0ACB9JIP3_9ASTR|nr:hypothetical protein L1987_07904 [Smallanthus sonchifolius]